MPRTGIKPLLTASLIVMSALETGQPQLPSGRLHIDDDLETIVKLDRQHIALTINIQIIIDCFDSRLDSLSS